MFLDLYFSLFIIIFKNLKNAKDGVGGKGGGGI